MNDIPRQKLKELVGRYGRSLGDDPLRCEGLLRDFCGQNRLEIFALSQAVKNGIPSELFNSSGQLPVEVTVLRFSKRLEDQCGMNPDLARWVAPCKEIFEVSPKSCRRLATLALGSRR